MNVGLIYNSEIRNNGSPIHIWSAFKDLGIEFSRYLPMGALPKHDFYVWCDDGRDDLKWLPPHPWGYWAVDTHLGWDHRFWKAQQADITWCAQKPAVERMRAAGINAHWLPLACNPMAHPTALELEKREMGEASKLIWGTTRDVGFVGFLQKPEESNRIEFLDAILKAYPNFLVGFGVFHEDMARFYHKCRVGINHAIRDDLNMRFFELASVGVPQLCDRRMVGLRDLGFFEGLHYFGYESTEEAIEKVKYMLEHPVDCQQVAQMALANVRRAHKYTDRVKTMMEGVSELLATPDRSTATA